MTPEGLKDVYKDFNYAGETLVERLRAFKDAGVHVLGSFISGCRATGRRRSRPPSAIATARA